VTTRDYARLTHDTHGVDGYGRGLARLMKRDTFLIRRPPKRCAYAVGNKRGALRQVPPYDQDVNPLKDFPRTCDDGCRFLGAVACASSPTTPPGDAYRKRNFKAPACNTASGTVNFANRARSGARKCVYSNNLRHGFMCMKGDAPARRQPPAILQPDGKPPHNHQWRTTPVTSVQVRRVRRGPLTFKPLCAQH
jgi:hypothetical protein